MPLFVATTDFDVQPYALPNLDKEINSVDAEFQSIQDEMLRKLLGYLLYKAFYTGIAVTPIENVEQRWKDLRDGKEYQYEGKTYKWEGMNKMLVPLVYSKYLSNHYDSVTGVGVSVAKTENSTPINPAQRIAKAYNNFTVYSGNLPYRDDSYGFESTRMLFHNTLYGFLYASGSTYLDVIEDEFTDIHDYLNYSFTMPGSMNTFNI